MIRDASDADWPAIWPILCDVAAAGDTFTFPRDIDEALARQLWTPGSPGAVLVAIDAAGAVIGSAKVGPNQLGPGGHVATASFVVAAEARRTGAGRALGQAAIDWACGAGFRAMQFNAVVATNAPAVALWRALGFAVVGTIPDAFTLPSGDYADLLMMHRVL